MHGAHPASPEPKRSAVVTCILNDAAGSGHLEAVRRWRREAAEAQLIRLAGEHGARAKILRARGGTELLAFAAQAVSEQSNPVVAGGGDGTVNAVATQLIGTGTALGVLPLGSLNHFSKDAGIPQDVEQAVSTVFAGRVTAVDVGEVNDRIFLNNSSLGTYPEVVRMREEEQRHGQGKWAALVHAWIAALRHDAQLHIRLREGERKWSPRCFSWATTATRSSAGRSARARRSTLAISSSAPRRARVRSSWCAWASAHSWAGSPTAI